MTAYDAVAAGSTGLPWPDMTHSGTMSLLQTLRTAAGVPVGAPAISVALPVPGDVRGLPAGTQFQRDAVTAGEAILVNGDPSSTAVGLVPDFEYDDSDLLTNPIEIELSGLTGRCTRCRQRRSPNTSTSARPNSRCGRRSGRPPTRWAPSAPRQAAWTSPIRAGSSSR